VEAISSTELVILGLLKRQSAHGYELLRTVRRQHMSEYIRLAPSGLYKALARLEDQGCVTARLEREGNRPERQTYSITRKGEARLEKLLIDHLRGTFEHFDTLSAALTFGELAPREAVSEELRRRREMVMGAQEEAVRVLVHVLVPPSESFFFERLRVERWAEHLAAERRWLDRAIACLADSNDCSSSKIHNDGLDRSYADEQPISAEAANADRGRDRQDLPPDFLGEERDDSGGQ
jgi:DNA-binding PadR family transcriptional regulator